MANEQVFRQSLIITGSVTSSVGFYGDGTGLTGITAVAEWDGSRNGDASITGSFVVSGSGVNVDFTNTTGVSGSFSGSFSGDGSGLTNITLNTGSLLVTASVTNNTITFTKGDSSTFPLTIATGSAHPVTLETTPITAYYGDRVAPTSGEGYVIQSTNNLSTGYFAENTGTGNAVIAGFVAKGSGSDPYDNVTGLQHTGNNYFVAGLQNQGSLFSSNTLNVTTGKTGTQIKIKTGNSATVDYSDVNTLMLFDSDTLEVTVPSLTTSIINSEATGKSIVTREWVESITGSISGPFTGSFTGSFTGDGSGLTGITATATGGIFQTGSNTGAIKTNDESYTSIASGQYSFAGGGRYVTASVDYTTALGGLRTAATATYATALGGQDVEASGIGAIAGGIDNVASGSYSAAFGGRQHDVVGADAAAFGGRGLQVTGGAAIGAGGYTHTVSGLASAVIGGDTNSATAPYSNVLGGCSNVASTTGSVILGGSNQTTDRDNVVVLNNLYATGSGGGDASTFTGIVQLANRTTAPTSPEVGMLMVSGSNLYFYGESGWTQLNVGV